MPSYRPKTTIEQWRILQAVVDFGGYAQAATALNKSQSSLNHAVTKLQSTLGVQLLEVKGRKAFLTDAGNVMLRRSRTLTQNIEVMEQLADNMTMGWETEIKITTEIIYPKQKLYSALEQFYPESRGTRIRITDQVITGTNDSILNKTADLVIGAIPPEGYYGDRLEQVNFVCYCGKGHKLASRKQVSLNELEHELQIVISDTGKTPQADTNWLKAEQRWTVTNFYHAIDLLKRNQGFCWIPTHFIKATGAQHELVEVPLTTQKTRSIITQLIIPDPIKLGPGATLLKNLILEQYK